MSVNKFEKFCMAMNELEEDRGKFLQIALTELSRYSKGGYFDLI